MIPTTKEEYEKRHAENSSCSGFGSDTMVHFPCPFCAAADWKVLLIHDLGAGTGKTTCVECKRTAHIEFDSSRPGVTSLRLVQDDGDPAPSWVVVSNKVP